MKILGMLFYFFSKLSAGVLFLFMVAAAGAQEQAPGPLEPAPEHNVRRVVGVGEPEAPPSLPPAQIIKSFSQKEDTYQAARPQYSYRKSIRIQEFATNGAPAGEYQAIYEAVRGTDGKLYEKAVSAPLTSLEYLQFEPDDVQELFHVPYYPLTTAQLSKYVVQFLSSEKVDEIDCYIFQVTPKYLERQHAYFDGVVWVDAKYLEVVKTYGKWVTDLGEIHPPSLPFTIFETYRENVDGKYWFPNYSRSEGMIKLKNHDVPVRVTIQWNNFKPFSVSPATPVPSSLTPPKPPPPTAPTPRTKEPSKP